MKKLIAFLLLSVIICSNLLCGCSKKEKLEEGTPEIEQNMQQVVEVNEDDININYANSTSKVAMGENDEYYAFMNSPKVTLLDKETGSYSGYNLFTEKTDVKRFFVYENTIYAVSNGELVTSTMNGSNIQSQEGVFDVYIEKDVIYYMKKDKNGNAQFYITNLSEQGKEEEFASCDKKPEEIKNFAVILGDIYITYTDQYNQIILARINKKGKTELLNLPPEYNNVQNAFTDGKNIYIYSTSNNVLKYNATNKTQKNVCVKGEPFNAKKEFLYIINQTNQKDIEIIKQDVKTDEEKTIYRSSQNQDSKELYNNSDYMGVKIYPICVFDDGVIIVESYWNFEQEQDDTTYLIKNDKIRKI